MNREISVKKFLLFLGIVLIFIICVLYIIFVKTKFFCKKDGTPCYAANCEFCVVENGKKICSYCNVFNEKNERIWTGGCIFDQ